MRPSGRAFDELRKVVLTRNYACHAEGSVLVEFGRTKVLCAASFENSVPPFLKGAGKGWVTAEYGMLPRSTNKRSRREAAYGRQGGRTHEIQRLIGRALRAVTDLSALGENTMVVDCDVIQADGGTRTAAITGGYVALADAVAKMLKQKRIKKRPLVAAVASVSVGMRNGAALLDLDYAEDSTADMDLNVVMNDQGKLIEIQGAAEQRPFTFVELDQLLMLARGGLAQLFALQAEALGVAAVPTGTKAEAEAEAEE